MNAFAKTPKTKADLIDRMLRRDFNGLESLSSEEFEVERTRANAFLLTFPETGSKFEISVRKPRSEEFRELKRRQYRERLARETAEIEAPEAEAQKEERELPRARRTRKTS